LGLPIIEDVLRDSRLFLTHLKLSTFHILTT
jgi:hypothetical protein